jgi:DNA-binding transcriptional MerR regulator
MLKIGDFSRLSQVSVDALRHYDTLGLLKPTEVDPFTGYRYYAFHQLGRLNRILALKDLGLSLEQIGTMLEGEVSAEQLKGMFKLKRAEIALHIEAEHERLARVEARLRQIDMEGQVPNSEVVIKDVRPQLVASLRRVMPSHTKIIPLYEELLAYGAEHNIAQALPITLWRDEGYREQDVDTEVCVVLKAPIPAGGDVKVYELPGGSMASIVHNGAYNTMPQAYSALNAWLDANPYRITGSARELYHYSQAPLRFDDDSYVTEIQIPVEKAPPAT